MSSRPRDSSRSTIRVAVSLSRVALTLCGSGSFRVSVVPLLLTERHCCACRCVGHRDDDFAATAAPRPAGWICRSKVLQRGSHGTIATGMAAESGAHRAPSAARSSQVQCHARQAVAEMVAGARGSLPGCMAAAGCWPLAAAASLAGTHAGTLSQSSQPPVEPAATAGRRPPQPQAAISQRLSSRRSRQPSWPHPGNAAR
jgi:hypothetical protein